MHAVCAREPLMRVCVCVQRPPDTEFESDDEDQDNPDERLPRTRPSLFFFFFFVCCDYVVCVHVCVCTVHLCGMLAHSMWLQSVCWTSIVCTTRS